MATRMLKLSPKYSAFLYANVVWIQFNKSSNWKAMFLNLPSNSAASNNLAFSCSLNIEMCKWYILRAKFDRNVDEFVLLYSKTVHSRSSLSFSTLNARWCFNAYDLAVCLDIRALDFRNEYSMRLHFGVHPQSEEEFVIEANFTEINKCK